MRRYASGQDEPREQHGARSRAEMAGTKRTSAEPLREGSADRLEVHERLPKQRRHLREATGRALQTLLSGARLVAPAAVIAAMICASGVSARFAPFDRKDRAAAALADGSTATASRPETGAPSPATGAASPAADADGLSLADAHSAGSSDSPRADLVPGIPDPDGRLLEQIRTAESLRSAMPAGNAPGAVETGDPALESAPAQSQDAPIRSRHEQARSKNGTLAPESADSDLPAQSLAWLGLFGVVGAGLTWWLSRRRPGRAVPQGSLSPQEVRAALAEIAASKRDIGRPDLSVITRASSTAIRARRDEPGARFLREREDAVQAIQQEASSGDLQLRDGRGFWRSESRKPHGSFPSRHSSAAPLRAAETPIPAASAHPAPGISDGSRTAEAPGVSDASRSAAVPGISESSRTAAAPPLAAAPVPAISSPAAGAPRDISARAVTPSTPSTATPAGVSSGEDRLERIERSLLAFTDVVKTLVENIPARGSEQEKSSAVAASDSVLGSDGTAPDSPDVASPAPADSALPGEPSGEAEADLGAAWDCFLQSEGVEPPKKTRRRSSGASRIARQGRAVRGATSRANTQEPATATKPATDAATGQMVPGDPLHDLGRIREVVLDLAGRGVPTEQICREVGLSSKEVGLILKSLFRANA